MDGKGHSRLRDDHDSIAARLIGRSRMIVIVAVMLSAFSLFLLGAVIAVETIWFSLAAVLGWLVFL